ncbi:hypothetical protein DL765_003579 [Monosporascus sp. GIB2]|nr:hypothetical protein DL765_003579 [Monosporascus sp. GIB2]
MDGTEKATYLIFGRGQDPKKLRLGNLVMFPNNPTESDPYICPLSELYKWTGDATEEPTLTIERRGSNDKGASMKLFSSLGGDTSWSKGSSLRVEGKNARRFQIDRTTEFLNSEILSSPEAIRWLNERIFLSKNQYRLNRLKMGMSRHPQVWMVTGIQMLSDATVRSGRTGSAKAGVNLQVPTPELALVMAAALGADGGMGSADVSISKEGESNVEYYHQDERVWAAQFRRLKLSFIKDGMAQLGSEKKVSIDALVDLGLRGMKGGFTAIEDMPHITGVCDEDVTVEEGSALEEEEMKLFEKLRTASGKRALLIGGSENKLYGIRRDLCAMADLFLDWGFNVSLCYGPDATRDGIIDAWRRLISQTPERSDDAVVVYYSGHGGAEESETSTEAFRIQYLLPFDIDQTTEKDFRGILDVELSYLVNCLTSRTHNVTIILDCCHAEGMAKRIPIQGVKTWSPLKREIIDIHMRRLRAVGLLEKLHIEGNRYAIRVAAAESNKPAFEDEAPQGKNFGDTDLGKPVMSRLTRELVLELQAHREKRISWDMVLPQLQSKLKEPRSKFQRPQVEGPRTRVLFSLGRQDIWGQLRVAAHESTVTLMGGGALAQVWEDDEYAIMLPAALSLGSTEQIAVARVTEVCETKAVASLEYCGEHGEVPNGAVAVPLRRFRPAYGVVIQAGDRKLATDLESRLEKSRIIHRFNTSSGSGQAPFATIKQDGNKLVLLHRKEEPTLEYPMLTASDYGDAANDLVFQLEKLVQADQLLTLAPSGSEHALDVSSVSIEIGLVRGGLAQPFKGGEHRVTEGERAYLIIRNDEEFEVYASVFLVTSMGTIEWRSRAYPSGASLPAGHEYVPGQISSGHPKVKRAKVRGQKHVWPVSVPRRGPLDEAYVVVLTNVKADLGFWENLYRPHDRSRAKEPGDDDEDYEADYLDDLRFSVRRVNFKLVPKEG